MPLSPLPQDEFITLLLFSVTSDLQSQGHIYALAARELGAENQPPSASSLGMKERNVRIWDSINVINMHYRDLIYTFLAVVNRPWTNYCFYRHFTKEEDPPVSSWKGDTTHNARYQSVNTWATTLRGDCDAETSGPVYWIYIPKSDLTFQKYIFWKPCKTPRKVQSLLKK